MLKDSEEAKAIRKDILLARACVRDVIVVGCVAVASG